MSRNLLVRSVALQALWFALLLGSASGVRAQSIPIPIESFAPVNIGAAIARENLKNISQLPPVTNLSFSYKYDPEIDSYVAQRDNLGSGMVVSPRFNRKGGFSVMLSFAYYRLDEFDGHNSTALVVNVPSDRFNPNSPRVDLGIAAKAAANVTASRFSTRYTILDKWDVGIAVPLVSVDVSSRYAVQVLNGPAEISGFLSQRIDTPDPDGNRLIDTPLNHLALPGGFNEGGNVDIGNIELDSKMGFDSGVENLNLGVQTVLRLPSGNEDRFTGRNSTSLRGLVLADYRLGKFGLFLTGGYENDFNEAFLSNAMFASSVTFAAHRLVNLEIGVRANLYHESVDLFNSKDFSRALPGTVIVGGDSTLGNQQVSVGGGVRFVPYGDMSVSAYISAPVTSDGYRADGIFSLAVDYPI